MRLTQKRLEVLLSMAGRGFDEMMENEDKIGGCFTKREIREMEEAIDAGYALLRRRIKKADAR